MKSGEAWRAQWEHPSYPHYLMIKRMWKLSTVSVFDLGCSEGVRCPALNKYCQMAEGYFCILYPVSPADLWCERTAETGWMSAGLML